MCGIVGYIGVNHREVITQLNNVQGHRGPDDEGYAFNDRARLALAMRRLSIVDIADGHQPMRDPSGRYTIVFNGEVVNAPSLRMEMEAKGVKFRTDHSDTEAVLNLFITEGPKSVRRLNGMFAFAIHDAEKQELFLARDPIGIKPLFYFQRSGVFAFASELKSLLQLPDVARNLDHQSLHHYLTMQFIPAPRTIYSDIRKLPGGSTMIYRSEERSMHIGRYWQPTFPSGLIPRSREEVVPELRTHLEQAVSDWMISDVEVGFSLSGGIDSAALVGLLASKTEHKIKTWTLGFEESNDESAAIDERKLARTVATRWGTDHHEIEIKASSILTDLEDMVEALDEPYAGGLPSWYVFKAMSRDVKVGIVGSGGDELFGNYGKWRVQRPFSLYWMKVMRHWLINHGLMECIKHPHGAIYSGYFGEREKYAMYTSRCASLESTPSLYEALWRQSGPESKQAVASIDFQMQLPEEFLMMTDRFSMAWSLEARPPLLDKNLVEYVMSIPPSLRSPDKQLKGLFIDAVRHLLPDELLSAPKKGFVLPLSHWLKNELKPMLAHYLGPDYLRQQGLFQEDLYRSLAKPHLDGKLNMTPKLWTILMFQLWWDRQNTQ